MECRRGSSGYLGRTILEELDLRSAPKFVDLESDGSGVVT